LFEEHGSLNNISKERWLPIVRSRLDSDLLYIVSSLPGVASYSEVVNAIFVRAGINQEFFRDKFHNLKRSSCTSWTNYCSDLKISLDNWLQFSNVKTFEALKELLLHEQLNSQIYGNAKTYLSDVYKSEKGVVDAGLCLDRHFDANKVTDRTVVKGRVDYSNSRKFDNFRNYADNRPYQSQTYNKQYHNTNQHGFATNAC
jgi:hypothetical protein